MVIIQFNVLKIFTHLIFITIFGNTKRQKLQDENSYTAGRKSVAMSFETFKTL